MDMPLAEMQRHLKMLRLHGMHATLETRLIQANQGASFAEVFASLVQDEVDSRNSRLLESRFKASGLPERPTLTEFDWGFNPKLPRKEIYELVSGKFVRDGEDALLVGSPGTGKSHIAKTVAQAAIQTGYKVVYREAHAFFEDLFESAQLKTRSKVSKLFSETDLLVIDSCEDPGYVQSISKRRTPADLDGGQLHITRGGRQRLSSHLRMEAFVRHSARPTSILPRGRALTRAARFVSRSTAA
jgi:DNA replication protein DnaC